MSLRAEMGYFNREIHITIGPFCSGSVSIKLFLIKNCLWSLFYTSKNRGKIWFISSLGKCCNCPFYRMQSVQWVNLESDLNRNFVILSLIYVDKKVLFIEWLKFQVSWKNLWVSREIPEKCMGSPCSQRVLWMGSPGAPWKIIWVPRERPEKCMGSLGWVPWKMYEFLGFPVSSMKIVWVPRFSRGFLGFFMTFLWVPWPDCLEFPEINYPLAKLNTTKV